MITLIKNENNVDILTKKIIPISKLLLTTVGCVEEYCVDDVVMDIKGRSGTIFGVNTKRNKLVVWWRVDEKGKIINLKTIQSLEDMVIKIVDSCHMGYCFIR